ncbi:MAG: DUF4926 domain-containing protein [Nitrospirae bacterium]|nr:DUF4926 domain-containing protein [Nitrospirota bacterium]
MIKELDTAVLKHDIKEHDLTEGDLGTVVHIYDDNNAFEVEFITAEGRTVAVLTLTDDDIRPMRSREILHVRDIAQAV